jgi:hypothetical protein
MAATPLEFYYASGLSLTAKLIDADDTVVVEFSDGTAPAEQTNGKGAYRIVYSGSETGWHTLHVFSGTTCVLVYQYYLEDTTAVHRPVGSSEVSIVENYNAIIARLDSLSTAAGAGAEECTMTVTLNGQPLADADAWITSDAAGLDVVAGVFRTNSSGQFTPLLDDGATYYMWVQKNGINSIRGRQFVAEAD